MWEDYFSVQIFFIILRETLESAIIISVLLSFLKHNFTSVDSNNREAISVNDYSTYKSLKLQVWVGALTGLGICMGLGGVFILVFYIVGNDVWSKAERLWEGIFSILSALIIAVMGLALLRVNQLQAKWRVKLGSSLNTKKNTQSRLSSDEHEGDQVAPFNNSNQIYSHDEELRMTDQIILRNVLSNPVTNADVELNKNIKYFIRLRERMNRFTEKYALALLPFVTTLREGLEAVVFIGGIGVGSPIQSFPLAIVSGALIGAFLGIALYRGGNKLSLQYFLVLSTCFLYMVAAGLLSRGVWFLELERFVRLCGQDTSETGSGPGSYDISNSIWHVNCCNGLTDGGWMLLNAIVGWTNSATYGSVISYIFFWIFVIGLLYVRSYREDHGYLPFVPIRWQLKLISKRIAFDTILIEEFVINSNNGYNDVSSDRTASSFELNASSENESTGFLSPAVRSAH